MDCVYDAAFIRNRIMHKGRKPLIDFNRRSPKDERKFENFEQERYKSRYASCDGGVCPGFTVALEQASTHSHSDD